MRQSKAKEKAQGHACGQVCSDNSWPARRSSSAEGKQQDTGLAGAGAKPAGRLPVPEAGSHGRGRAVRQENMAGGVPARRGAERRGRS